MARTNWDEVARRSPREAAVATKRIEHEGKVLEVDIVMFLRGGPRAYYHDVALDVPRLKLSSRDVDDPSLSWRPY
jgi:hypothetical protein